MEGHNSIIQSNGSISMVLIRRFTSIRYLSFCLVFLTGFFAMFITNDVALLTMVPLTILIAKRCKFNPVWIAIYQTLAANVGSSLTPMGNPLKIDYFLLGTFIAFFLIVGSISQLPGLTSNMTKLLSGEGSTFLCGVLSSQVISNVPAAVLLANFSGDYPLSLY